jgi:hypothetical protein
MAGSIDTLAIQWQAAMERLKHHEALTVTGLGLYLAALAYAFREVLAHNPTEEDYWGVAFVLIVLCICLLHGVDRVNDSATGVMQLEADSQGKLTYMSNLARRVTLTATFGFLAIFVGPALSVLYIIFAYRRLASNSYYPFIVLIVSSLIFIRFAFGILREQRRVVNWMRSLEKRR